MPIHSLPLQLRIPGTTTDCHRKCSTSSASINMLKYVEGCYCVISKPHDVRMDGSDHVTVMSLLKEKLKQIREKKQQPMDNDGIQNIISEKLFMVHQLDYATSGVVCFGFSKNAAASIAHHFRNRTATKTYLALVWGHMQEDKFLFDSSLASIADDDFHQEVGSVQNPGRCAMTHARVLFRGNYKVHSGIKRAVTLVMLSLFTGRRHQLRVHLLNAGHPIVGDYAYAHTKDDWACSRMMLHAYQIRIPLTTPYSLIDIVDQNPFFGLIIDSQPSQFYKDNIQHNKDNFKYTEKNLKYLVSQLPDLLNIPLAMKCSITGVVPYCVKNGDFMILLSKKQRRIWQSLNQKMHQKGKFDDEKRFGLGGKRKRQGSQYGDRQGLGGRWKNLKGHRWGPCIGNRKDADVDSASVAAQVLAAETLGSFSYLLDQNSIISPPSPSSISPKSSTSSVFSAKLASSYPPLFHVRSFARQLRRGGSGYGCFILNADGQNEKNMDKKKKNVQCALYFVPVKYVPVENLNYSVKQCQILPKEKRQKVSGRKLFPQSQKWAWISIKQFSQYYKGNDCSHNFPSEVQQSNQLHGNKQDQYNSHQQIPNSNTLKACENQQIHSKTSDSSSNIHIKFKTSGKSWGICDDFLSRCARKIDLQVFLRNINKINKIEEYKKKIELKDENGKTDGAIENMKNKKKIEGMDFDQIYSDSRYYCYYENENLIHI